MAKKPQPSQPPSSDPGPRDFLEIVGEVAVYPAEAYEFVQLGLQYTSAMLHPLAPGDAKSLAGGTTAAAVPKRPKKPNRRPRASKGGAASNTANKSPEASSNDKPGGPENAPEQASPAEPEVESRHITGQQLSVGLRDYAWKRWGLMARTVLGRWNVTSTLDFGRVVYALIEAGMLSKTDSDRIDDFRSVFDFRTLDTDYVMPSLFVSPPAPPVADLQSAPTEAPDSSLLTPDPAAADGKTEGPEVGGNLTPEA